MIEQVLDPYERNARLLPAVLALIPVLSVTAGLYGASLEWKETALGVLVASGMFYLLASIARELGKRLEADLFKSWGGKPTTQVLRHRDETIDVNTKARYHRFLAGILGTPFPDPTQERDDPGAADQVYASGTRWLLDQTRDTKSFGLLFKENVAYGFRRNALGLRPYAMLAAVLAILWVTVDAGAVTLAGLDTHALATMRAPARISIGISAAALMVWQFFFTPRTVRSAAFSYADMLLRACDNLSTPRSI